MQNDTIELLNKIVAASFIPTFLVMGVVSFLLFHIRKNAAFRRKWFPRFAILWGVWLVFFSSTMAVLKSRSFESLWELVFLVPAVALIIYLGIKFTKFCDQCGATVYKQNLFSRLRFCPKCGASFDAKPKD